VRVTRCSNNYGHHHFPEKLIPLFITNLLDGLTVPLYGDGLNVRDWLHIDDHVRGVDLVRTKGVPGEVYNIGGGTELSNKELTALLLEACGAGWEMVEYVEDRKGHDRRYSGGLEQDPRRTRLCTAQGVRDRTRRDSRLVPGQPALVGTAQKARPGACARRTGRGPRVIVPREVAVVSALSASRYAPGARYWISSALRRASIVSPTVRRTVVSNELSARPPVIASATAAMETLSGASHRV
jgi:NAD-dependent epimerase/dehydratase family protein